MKNTNFEKYSPYRIGKNTAYFLGMVDGINLFSLEIRASLYCFYFEKNELHQGNIILDRKKIRLYTKEELPSIIKPSAGNKISISEKEYSGLILTSPPPFPNTALCPAGLLDVVFERRGIVFSESSEITLGKQYRALHPDYCLIKGDELWRQTDMREKYPGLVLKMSLSGRGEFTSTSRLEEKKTVYLSANSVESYGGTHEEYLEWEKRVAAAFEEYFKEYKMAKFKRVFAVKPEKEDYLRRLGLDPAKIVLLK